MGWTDHEQTELKKYLFLCIHYKNENDATMHQF